MKLSLIIAILLCACICTSGLVYAQDIAELDSEPWTAVPVSNVNTVSSAPSVSADVYVQASYASSNGLVAASYGSYGYYPYYNGFSAYGGYPSYYYPSYSGYYGYYPYSSYYYGNYPISWYQYAHYPASSAYYAYDTYQEAEYTGNYASVAMVDGGYAVSYTTHSTPPEPTGESKLSWYAY